MIFVWTVILGLKYSLSAFVYKRNNNYNIIVVVEEGIVWRRREYK